MKKDYDKKLFRFIKILNILQDSGRTTTTHLAAEFNVSRRTAQRDILRLMTAGFPIEEDLARKGAYAFAEGYSLKGAPVSGQEISLLVSLCDVARDLGGEFEAAYKTIFAKVMNTSEWESPFLVMMPKPGQALADQGMVKTAKEAIESNKKLRITYQSSDDPAKVLVVDPLKLLYYEGFWYLASRPSGQTWVIKNRLDRISSIEAMEESFKPPKKLEKLFRESQSIWFTDRRDTKVLIRVAPEVSDHFIERIHFPRQKIAKRSQDGAIVIQTMVGHYMEVLPTIFRWIPHLKVLRPKGLADEVREAVEEYLETL